MKKILSLILCYLISINFSFDANAETKRYNSMECYGSNGLVRIVSARGDRPDSMIFSVRNSDGTRQMIKVAKHHNNGIRKMLVKSGDNIHEDQIRDLKSKRKGFPFAFEHGDVIYHCKGIS